MYLNLSSFVSLLGLFCFTTQVLAQADTVYSCQGETTGVLADIGYDLYRWSPSTDLQSPNGRRVVYEGTTNTTLIVEQQSFIGPNLIVNPNFEDGDSNFSSDYRSTPGGSSAQGTYSIVSDASGHNPSFSPCTDAAIPGNFILAADGSALASDAIWCQTIPINPLASFGFSFDLASLSNGNPCTLRIEINGVNIGGSPTGDVQACFWKRATIFWTATGTSTAEICIYNLNTSASGNDFAIDDMAFTELGPITLDSFYVSLGDQSFGQEEVKLCDNERYTEHGLDLGIGESGNAILQNAEGCDSILTISTILGDSLLVNQVIDTLCNGDTLRVDNWVITTDTILSRTIPASAGCDTIFTLEVRYFTPNNIEKNISNPSCDGDTDGEIILTNLAGSGSIQFTWDDGPTGPIRQDLPPRDYTYEAVDQKGCRFTESILLENPDPIAIEDILTVGVRCADEMNGFAIVDVSGGTGPIERIVEQNGNLFNIDTLRVGVYNLTLRDSLGCSLTDNFTIPGPGPIRVSLTGDTLVRLGALANHQVSFSGDNATFSLTYNDQPIDSLIDMGSLTWSPQGDGLLVATVIDENGCEASQSTFVRLQSRDTEFFPNAFSPNEDGINDRFGPARDQAIVAFEEFIVADRWGNIIYSVKDCPIDVTEACYWDGKREDKSLGIGVYVFYASLLLTDGTTIQRTGEVTLAATLGQR